MFEQSMVVTSPETRRRKRWAALMSVAVETAAVAAALSLPLFTGQALPPIDPPPPFVPAYHPPRQDSVQVFHDSTQGDRRPTAQPINALVAPISIPTHISPDPGPIAPPQPQAENIGPYIPGTDFGPNTGRSDRTMVSILRPDPVIPVRKPVTVTHRTSEVMESLLLHRVNPVYPPMARNIGLQGPVVLQAMISRTGTIQELQVLSGHPMLVKAAAEAVLQWRYRPFYLNGQPVDVRTEITVNFVLGR